MSLKNLTYKAAVDIPPLPIDTYMGVCIAVVDLGEQYQQYDKQKQGKYVNECMFIFEIPGERIQIDGEDKPRWVNRRVNQSLYSTSALYGILESWRGHPLTEQEKVSGVDLTALNGKPAMLSVTIKEGKDGKERNVITGISKFPKGITPPQPESELLIFDIDEPDMETFNKLPKWIQNIIEKSTQFARNPPTENVEFSDITENQDDVQEGVCPI